MSTKKKLSPKEDDKTLQPLDKVGTETLIALLSCDTRTEASDRLGISRNALYERITKYGLEAHIAKVPEQALSVMRQGSLKASENYVKKIDHRDPRISLEASNQILDRIGLGTKVSQTNNQTNIQVVIPNSLQNKYGVPSSPREDNTEQ